MAEVSYKIIGGDGREYGPIALNDVRDWIDDDRVAPDTRVWSSEDERWLPAVERTELRWTFEMHQVPPVRSSTDPGQLEPEDAPSVPAVTLANRPPVLLRLAAIGCDYVLFTLALSVLTSPWSAQIREMNEAALKNLGGPAPDPKLVWDMLRYLGTAVLPASYVYYAALPALFGMTPGKFVARLVVVPVDGGTLGWGRATVRWAGSLLCVATFGFGFLPLFFTPRRQGLHDLIAGTCVLRRRD